MLLIFLELTKMVQCNVCESGDNKELFYVSERSVVQCLNCGLIYVANPMNSEETKEYYEHEYYTGYNRSAVTSCYGQGESFRIKEAKNRLSTLGHVNSLLDVGCGMGFFVKTASEIGITAIGIDISQNAVTYGQSQGLDLRQGDLLYSQDFKNDSFDLITFWASIEHLYHPKETLQKAHQLLKPNGVIVIETGNFDSYFAKIFKNKWRLVTIDHNFYFSSQTLDNLLRTTGFETFRTDNDGFMESIITQLGFRDVILNKFVQSSNNSKERGSSLKEKVNSVASKLSLGDVMIKYARKI